MVFSSVYGILFCTVYSLARKCIFCQSSLLRGVLYDSFAGSDSFLFRDRSALFPHLFFLTPIITLIPSRACPDVHSKPSEVILAHLASLTNIINIMLP